MATFPLPWLVALVTVLLGQPAVQQSSEQPLMGTTNNHLLVACRATLRLLDESRDVAERTKEITELSAVHAGWCSGAVAGVVDMSQAMRPILDQCGGHGLFCAPKEVTRYQTVAVVVKYLEDHPEKLHESYLLGIVQGLSEAFPCSGQLSPSTNLPHPR